MFGLMMDEPLLISSVIEHAAKFHGGVEVVYKEVDGSLQRYTYRDVRRRSKMLAKALKRHGIQFGDRIGTMAWNSHRHFELYFGISGIGAVMHTVNPRLFSEQISYIINHARDRMLFFEPSFMGIVEQLAPQLASVETYVVMAPCEAIPATSLPVLSYEEFIAEEDDDLDWPSFDERTASSLCYTSGTTGNPRGALYNHRSTILHAISACAVDGHGVSGGDCILPVVPMFHGNAWGIPYSATLSGAKLVLAGQQTDGATLAPIFLDEQVTLSLAVPTVWLGLLDHAERHGITFDTLQRVIIGGSAVPQSLIERFRDKHGVRVIQAWGMTEMSPFGASATPLHKHLMAGREALDAIGRTQGRPPFLVDAKLVDGNGNTLPHDGKTSGDMYVRGPWVIREYYQDAEATADAFAMPGWLKTGDVCTIDEDGYIQIVDRSKDVIKSGGEWISSIELENIAMAHPAIAEAAVIAVKHPKWDERPLLVVVAREGMDVERADLLEFFEGRVARWWYPDDVVVVPTIPHTATGKVSKARLREQLAGYALPVSSINEPRKTS
jgi:acyl-CoA synthetase (AMP-forming)/AMP-acid ligase II